MLRTAQIVSDESGEDEVGINDTVQIYIEDEDETETYRVVTSIREFLEGLISTESPPLERPSSGTESGTGWR